MGNEKKLSPYEVLRAFFDEGSFTEIGALLKGGSDEAEAAAGFGTVDGAPAYAFAQNAAVCGGAMSKAQSRKITKLFNSALKTGAPVVGFFDSIGGRLDQKYELLAAYGDILRKASKLSGVVPMISVILGDCVGSSALIASCADYVIMTEGAQLSIDGADGSAEKNLADGSAHFIVKDAAEAAGKAKALLGYFPTNNLEAAPAFESVPAYSAPDKLPKYFADEDSLLCVGDGAAYGVCTAFGRVDGAPVGVVVTNGEDISSMAARKIAKHVRFCDAFSLPMITIVDAKGFDSLKDASALVSAYSEATSAKISVISGSAFGAVYIALAGTASGSDMVFALTDAVVSPIAPKAAAFMLEPSIADLPYSEQDKAIESYIKAELTAVKAAEDGYVDDVIDKTQLRNKITAALTMLSSKRVATLPKKHTTNI